MNAAIEKTQVLILDCESTGVSNADEIIELAYIQASDDIRKFIAYYIEAMPEIDFPQQVYNERFNPSVPINPHASKVHGISKLKLLKCRPSSEAVIPANVKYLVGHNISFDHRMLGKPDVLLIDTLTLVKTLRKFRLITNNDDEGKDKLDVLIAHYFPEIAKTLIKPLHSALDDCYKVILLLSVILEKFPTIETWDQLFELQTKGKTKK